MFLGTVLDVECENASCRLRTGNLDFYEVICVRGRSVRAPGKNVRARRPSLRAPPKHARRLRGIVPASRDHAGGRRPSYPGPRQHARDRRPHGPVPREQARERRPTTRGAGKDRRARRRAFPVPEREAYARRRIFGGDRKEARHVRSPFSGSEEGGEHEGCFWGGFSGRAWGACADVFTFLRSPLIRSRPLTHPAGVVHVARVPPAPFHFHRSNFPDFLPSPVNTTFGRRSSRKSSFF